MNRKLRIPTILSLAGFVIIMAGVIYAESVINPLLMALFISIIFTQPIVWLKKKHVPHGAALAIMVSLLVFVYFGFFELIGSSISLFLEDAPKYQQNFKELSATAHQRLTESGINLDLLQGSHAAHPVSILDNTSEIISTFREFLSGEITFIFLVVFLLAEIEAIFFKTKLLERNSPFSLSIMEQISSSIRRYLSIKALTSLATGILVGVALWIIGVDYPLLWGLVAFLLNFIPTVGSIIAAVPAILISIVQLGFPATWWTIATYVFVNVAIGSVLEPKIMGQGLGLSITVVFLSLIFWGLILGPVGMFLSVPLTMLIKIVLDNFPNTKWIAALLGTKEDAWEALRHPSN